MRRAVCRYTVSTLGIAALFAALAAPALSAGRSASAPSGDPAPSCERLTTVEITSGAEDPALYHIDSAVEAPAGQGAPATCRVQLSVTHPQAGDHVTVWIWLPITGWNGRFEGTGGGGYAGGSPQALVGPTAAGYAAGATDTGHTGAADDASFALTAGGAVNQQAIDDWAQLGVHEMTVAGKALVRAYYGVPQRHAYFSGCSAGGRNALMEAERYPLDYDGVAAGAPAVNMSRMLPAELWGEIVMLDAHDFVPSCRFAAATTAAVKACDGLDGVLDGMIGDPQDCHFDPATLVGVSTPCGAITATDAAVIRRIWDGARTRDGRFLWYMPLRGAGFATLSNTADVGGQTVGVPFTISTEWYRWFLARDPSWDWTTVTPERFEQLFAQSVAEWSGLDTGATADLRAFRDAGGKAVIWQGWADSAIPPQGSVAYLRRLEGHLGGAAPTRRVARLFLAPGVDHCGGGVGPVPVDPLKAVVDWVEHGKSPRSLPAVKRDASGAVTVSRPICPYPRVAIYRGHGDVNAERSFRCGKVRPR